MGKPRALDLFCGAGGASMGLHRAGFDVTGIDVKPQPRYPFRFIQADALVPPVRLEDFDFIWASPPCQAWTNQGKDRNHPKLIEPVRRILEGANVPYVIENVVRAPLIDPVMLCGSMFGLGVRRHRKFEGAVPVLTPLCKHSGQDIRAYYGAWGREAFRAKTPSGKDTLRGTVERAHQDMGIDWMTWPELTQAIPPAYSEYIAREFLRQAGREAA